MSDQTKKYRIRQFERLDIRLSEKNSILKIINLNGETAWLDISEKELGLIKLILTREKGEITFSC